VKYKKFELLPIRGLGSVLSIVLFDPFSVLFFMITSSLSAMALPRAQ